MTWRAMELPNINAEGKSDVGAHAYRKLDVTGLALDQIKVEPRDNGCQVPTNSISHKRILSLPT